MSEGAQPTTDEIRAAAAAAVANDPIAAQLLARKAQGEKLTPSEHGKLGALASKAKRLFGMGDTPGKPTTAGNGNAAPMAPLASAETSGDELPIVEPDTGLCQRTTKSILERMEAGDKRKLKTAARLAYPTADDQTLARCERAAGLGTADKTLLVELSPDVARELGIDPRHFAIGIFLYVFIDWRLEFWAALDELKAKAKEREPKPAAAAAATISIHNDLPPVVPSPLSAKPGGDIKL